MLRRLLLLVCSLSIAHPFLHGQAIPAATGGGGLQVGAGFVRANPDYSPHQFNGFGIYADADLWRHFGAEAEFHHLANSSPSTITENTYEVGARYRFNIYRFQPYAKILIGRGTFNYGSAYATGYQNGGYLMFAGGGGVDFRASRKINIRADYEYQHWGSFPPNGLQPNLFTIGAAYRFR